VLRAGSGVVSGLILVIRSRRAKSSVSSSLIVQSQSLLWEAIMNSGQKIAPTNEGNEDMRNPRRTTHGSWRLPRQTREVEVLADKRTIQINIRATVSVTPTEDNHRHGSNISHWEQSESNNGRSNVSVPD
jgi:hypothetical protein